MLQQDINERTNKVWNWCCAAFTANGKILRFPANTKPDKTYTWRYATRLAEKLEEWDFDDNTSIKFIDTAVTVAKEHRLIHNGLQSLLTPRILELCYKRLQIEERRQRDTIRLIQNTKQLLLSHGATDPYVLLQKPSIFSYCLLTKLYQEGSIPDIYLAFSMSCFRALAVLAKTSPKERAAFPTRADLFILSEKTKKDVNFKKQIRLILENDWRNPWPQ